MAPNKDKKIKQTMALFMVTFLISLVVITYFIKSFSPNVDVEIGGEDKQTVEESTDSDIKQAIDDRLRWIQMEDNMPGVSKRDEAQTDDVTYMESEKEKSQEEKKQTDSHKDKTVKMKEAELQPIEYVNPQHKVNTPPPVPAEKQPSAEPFKMSKVYVGSYPTIEQAIQAQNKLMSTTVSVSPFVKEVNGSYVLQAGSYANPQKAAGVAAEINSVGFHAKVVKE